jgi:hypothetical protein
MTNRVQTNRSFVTGVRPSAGARKPGELYTNIPDLQISVIDEGRNPTDLLAVRFFSPAASYPVGAFVVHSGAFYVSNTPVTPGAFNPAQWTAK